jgi:hypothetical protein
LHAAAAAAALYLLLLLALLMPHQYQHSIAAAGGGVAHAPAAFHLTSCYWRWPLHTGGPALSLSKNSHWYTSSRGSGNVGDAEIKMINECYDKCINDALEGGKPHSHMPADTQHEFFFQAFVAL